MRIVGLVVSLLFVVTMGVAQMEVNNTTGNISIGTVVPNTDTKLLMQSASLYGMYMVNTGVTTGSPAQPNKTANGIYIHNSAGSYSGTSTGIAIENSASGAGGFPGSHSIGLSINNTGYGGASGTYAYGISCENTITAPITASAYGGRFTTTTTSTEANVYGIYSTVSGVTPAKTYSGYFTGGRVLINNNDLYVTGNVYANNFPITSDERLKSDIKPLTNEIDKLYQLQGKSYKKAAVVIELQDTLSIELRAKNERKIVDPIAEFGYLAQELKEVFPELVSMDSTSGYYSVNYIGLIPVMVEALKVQQQRIEYLEETIAGFNTNDTLKSAAIDESEAIQNMCFSDNAAIEGLKLYQNAPNPFNERTTVKCYVPQQIQKVQLCVYNMQGVQVQCITIVERGNISIEIEAGALSAGIYGYVLLADGAASETKQMILTK
ncbi:MAG: tail fiber domain-containing protein [Bacteroidales bacterium]|jgi:hypothetical protein|nr:tail fiber domain-containing protein [Bacteroidales bacterium]